jgi:hypothetical protein
MFQRSLRSCALHVLGNEIVIVSRPRGVICLYQSRDPVPATTRERGQARPLAQGTRNLLRRRWQVYPSDGSGRHAWIAGREQTQALWPSGCSSECKPAHAGCRAFPRYRPGPAPICSLITLHHGWLDGGEILEVKLDYSMERLHTFCATILVSGLHDETACSRFLHNATLDLTCLQAGLDRRLRLDGNAV